MNQEADILRVEGLGKVFPSGTAPLVVFDNLSFRVKTGEMLAIVGESGAGKSTLLHILGALDSASKGDVYCGPMQLRSLSDEAAAEFRNREIGFVWQFHYLLPEFTAIENVAMPLLIARTPMAEASARARGLLEELGLADRLHHRPGALSGGEQQRVAVARALVRSPRALLADEPTGNLDQETGDRLFDLLKRLNKERRITVVLVTHNDRLATACDRTLRLQGGALHPVSGQGVLG